MRIFYTFLLFFFSTFFLFAQNAVSFEDFELPPDTFLSNAPTGIYESGVASFPNSFNPDFGGFWESGWAISTMQDDTTASFENLYSAKPAAGFESTTYAIGQQNAIVHLGAAAGKVANGLYITNTTYAHGSMREGDDFAKKFGGDMGTDPDFFKLEIQGYFQDALTANTVEFYLADFRFEVDSLDYIVTDWQWVDLSNLGNVDSLKFILSSSDEGEFGINTPLFFAIDQLEISNLVINVPEDENISTFEESNLVVNEVLNGSEGVAGYQSGNAFFPTNFNPDFGGFWESGWAISTMRDSVTSGFTNLFSAKTNAGFSSFSYAVGQQNAKINLTGESVGKIVSGFYLTNTTYAYNSMRDGDDFAKKFGGVDGTEPDFFKLEIQKYSNGELQPQVVEFYLADFRFEDDSQDYIVRDWEWLDLTSLGNVDSLQFTLSSSDEGEFGINTPLFFCIDNFEASQSISTSLNQLTFKPVNLQVFPNPTAESLQVVLPNTQWKGIAQVFNLSGKQLIETPLTNFGNQIDVYQLPAGGYIVQLTTEKGISISRTFIKQ